MKMKHLFDAELYKLRISHLFKLFVFWSFFASVFSVLIVKILGNMSSVMSPEMLNQMLSNGEYNFGFIQVKDISDLINMTSIFAISSSFKNYFVMISIAVFISLYLRPEFKKDGNGGVRNFLLKGIERYKLILSKYIVIVIATALSSCIYFTGYCCMSMFIFGGLKANATLLLHIIGYLTTQMLLLISFASICFMMVICIQRSIVIFANASMVLLGTMVINIIMILTNSQVDLSRFWILSYIQNSEIGNIDPHLIIVSIATILVTLFISNWRFRRLEFK
jgi:hypothetical protein